MKLKGLIKKVLVLSIILTTVSVGYAQNVQEPSVIKTSSELIKEEVPTIVEFNLEIETRDKNSNKAIEENKAITTKVINAIKSEIDQSKGDLITTQNFSLNPQYVYKDKKSLLDSYLVRNSVKVRVKGINKIGIIIDKAVLNGASRVNGIKFKLENENNACNELYVKAAQNALNKAKIIAKGVNAEVIGISKINSACYIENNTGRVYSAKAMLNSNAVESSLRTTSDSRSTVIEPGVIKIRAIIDGEFKIK